MEIFIDSAVLSEIERWIGYGVVDGVTTNPTILLKAGVRDMEARQRAIAKMIHPRPLSVEVISNDPDGMIPEARRMADWAPNIAIKIPVITQDGEPCLGVIRTLAGDGIPVNATAMMSLGQVMLATKAGATFVSIFAGRVADEGNDAPSLVRSAAGWLARWGYSARIVVGSIRGVIDIQQAAIAGAHVITVPPPMLRKMADHKYSRYTIRQFNKDARKVSRTGPTSPTE